tara:strand:- start:348 stop:812 length:465 start_codon:yes stop_codon:yes gene_type:complete
MATNYTQSSTKPPFIKAKGGVQSDAVTVAASATTGTGGAIIPANASVVKATSDGSSKIIYLPQTYVAGTEILISSASAVAFKLRALPSAPFDVYINNVQATNVASHAAELNFPAAAMFRCVARGVNGGASPQQLLWTISAIDSVGAVTSAGNPS